MSAGDISSKLTIKEQADFVQALADRCLMLDKSVAYHSTLSLTADEVHELYALAARLERMAPHQAEIRKMVSGK